MESEKDRSEDDYDYLLKVVLIGDSNVGKSNLLRRLVMNDYDGSSKPTIGVEFGNKMFHVQDKAAKIQVWDTAGQERYKAVTTAYYRGSNGGVIVYDVTSKQSLENALLLWLKELRNAVGDSVPVILVGNKIDLKSFRQVEAEDGRMKAQENSCGFFETSALTGENVLMAFQQLAEQVVQREEKERKGTKKAKVRREDLVGEKLKKANERNKSSGCC